MNIVNEEKNYFTDSVIDELIAESDAEKRTMIMHEFASEVARDELIRLAKKCIFGNEKCKELLLDGAKTCIGMEFDRYIKLTCFYVGIDNWYFYSHGFKRGGLPYDEHAYSVASDIRQHLYGAD